jgi:hypothetical protein
MMFVFRFVLPINKDSFTVKGFEGKDFEIGLANCKSSSFLALVKPSTSFHFKRALFTDGRRKNVCVINLQHMSILSSLSSYFHASLEWHRKTFVVSSFIVDLWNISRLSYVFVFFLFSKQESISFLAIFMDLWLGVLLRMVFAVKDQDIMKNNRFGG